MENLFKTAGHRADFLLVYTREAFPKGERGTWSVNSNTAGTS